MNDQVKTDDETGAGDKGLGMSCCGPEGMTGMMERCCGGMKGCRWFPLFPILLGVALFLVGYFLSAEVVRILWLIFAAIPIVMGVFGFIMMSIMFRK